MMKHVAVALSVSILLACLGGCKGSAKGKDVIAVIPKGTTHVFWKSVEAGARKAAAEENVEMIWKAGVKEDDLDAQVTVVEAMISQGVKGIVLAPLHQEALVKQVAAAKKKNIPVVIIGSALEGNDFVSFVATDSRKGGEMAAKEMIRLAGATGGKLVVLRYLEGHASTGAREDGFIDAIKAYNEKAEKKFELVSTNQRAGDVDEALKKAEDMKAALEDAVGVYTPNEPTTFGMLRGLQNLKLAGKVRFVGFDGGKNLADGLAAKQIDALVLQDPVRMGYLGVKTLLAHIHGQKVEPVIDTGCCLATPDNMNTPEVKGLLVPETK
ncbi:MAG: substrate-binding domain-containing protein [Planctomycetota bacterium]|nr:substrate-binding domain-containing protein [Planctomycetota bacterium]